MIIKGKSRGNGAQLADYLVSKRDNDLVQILDVRGTATPQNLKRSLLEMSLSSEQTKGVHGLYHLQLNPNPKGGEDRAMAQADWLMAADIAEKHLGLNNQKRAIVLHEKSGRVHAHIVWERYDHEKGRLISDSKNYKAQDKARAELEQVLNHERTPQKRDKTKEPEHKAILTEIWVNSANGHEFREKAKLAGYEIARGLDRRPFKVVTPDGVSLDLVRQLEGIKTAQVAGQLNSVKLPMEVEALKLQKSLEKDQDKTKEKEAANDNEMATKEQKLAEFQDNTKETTQTERNKVIEAYKKEAERILEENRKRGRDRGLDR
jgi:hypothetical protein